MTSMQRLKPDGQRLATPELASGQQRLWAEEAWRDVVEPLDRAFPLEPLDAALDALLARTPAHQVAIDVEIAPLVHRHLPLSRREASDAGVWQWLAIVHRPDVVRHRWENSSWSTMRTRFLRPGTRPDANAFSRWWWIAELTRNGEDYGLTRRVLRRQPLATAIFVRSLSFYRPAICACVELLEDLEATAIERVMLELSRFLATVPLEAMSEGALREDLARMVARVQAG